VDDAVEMFCAPVRACFGNVLQTITLGLAFRIFPRSRQNDESMASTQTDAAPFRWGYVNGHRPETHPRSLRRRRTGVDIKWWIPSLAILSRPGNFIDHLQNIVMVVIFRGTKEALIKFCHHRSWVGRVIVDTILCAKVLGCPQMPDRHGQKRA
jgi:hypothetical protein